jgi:hypothetical protein
MSYTTEDLQEKLAEFGEIILVMDSDAYAERPELHLHDTEFDHDKQQIWLSLANGGATFDAENVETWVYHEQTLDELGI